METLVKIENLTKRFGSTVALDDVSLEIPAGRIVGLLGANGAGKSTLLRTIAGLIVPDQGSCKIFGRPCADLEEAELVRLGYVDQAAELIEWMKGGQFLDYLRVYYPAWNREIENRLVEQFEIELDKRIAAMSPGQRQKLAIISAVAFEPKLLLLDEPAAGLDPLARAQLIELLLEWIQSSDRTILISSHILSDVEKIVDHVLILDDGVLIRDAGLDALREEYVKVQLTPLQGDMPPPVDWDGILESRWSPQGAVLMVQGQGFAAVQKRAAALRCEARIFPMALDEIYRWELKAQA